MLLFYPINLTWTHYMNKTDGICAQIWMFQVPNSSFTPAMPVFGHFQNPFCTSGWKVAGGCASVHSSCGTGRGSWVLHRPTALALLWDLLIMPWDIS